MSKKQGQKRHPFDISLNDGPLFRCYAREAREAVRLWCARQPREFWNYPDKTVVKVEGGIQQERIAYWSIDSSQPPAWIIEPYRGDEP